MKCIKSVYDIFYKQNAKWNANLDSLSSLGPQELFKYLGN